MVELVNVKKMKYAYKHSFFNFKLIYDLKTPFNYKKKSKRNKVRCRYGCLYMKKTHNNMFLTTVFRKSGNVIASFSSKMFKLVEGKRQTFALILLKKLVFIVGVKTFINKVYDIYIFFYMKIRRRRLFIILNGLKKSGVFLRKFYFKRRISHNGCRGKSKRRI